MQCGPAARTGPCALPLVSFPQGLGKYVIFLIYVWKAFKAPGFRDASCFFI